jgi:hypothetical protein
MYMPRQHDPGLNTVAGEAIALQSSCFQQPPLFDHHDPGYAVYEPGRPDADAARMIEEYDPEWEIVFQYLQTDGNVRTVRIRTASGIRHPWRIYLFEQLIQREEQ